VRHSADELSSGFATLPDATWSALVVTAQGRTVPVSQARWLRAREVAIHSLDLATGLGFGDLPDGFCRALVEDIARWRSGRGDGPALLLTDGEQDWRVSGVGVTVRVRKPVPELAAWLAGRASPPDLPALASWL
jgi:maleylpyruvate isomerase